jgi:hypothetical protein
MTYLYQPSLPSSLKAWSMKALSRIPSRAEDDSVKNMSITTIPLHYFFLVIWIHDTHYTPIIQNIKYAALYHSSSVSTWYSGDRTWYQWITSYLCPRMKMWCRSYVYHHCSESYNYCKMSVSCYSVKPYQSDDERSSTAWWYGSRSSRSHALWGMRICTDRWESFTHAMRGQDALRTFRREYYLMNTSKY